MKNAFRIRKFIEVGISSSTHVFTRLLAPVAIAVFGLVWATGAIAGLEVRVGETTKSECKNICSTGDLVDPIGCEHAYHNTDTKMCTLTSNRVPNRVAHVAFGGRFAIWSKKKRKWLVASDFHSGCKDLSGKWKNTLTDRRPIRTTTWRLTPRSAGGYDAKESGLGSARGTAVYKNSRLRIDWAIPGLSGSYFWDMYHDCSVGYGVVKRSDGREEKTNLKRLPRP